MKMKYIDSSILYDGSQLRSLYAYETQQLLGDSIIAWSGKCDVSNAHMKDGEDLFQGEKIYSERMLHFIIEVFEVQLRTMVSLQRLFSAILKDQLQTLNPSLLIIRSGDDLYIGDKKLNVSIASIGPISAMIHCGINISSKNTPVPTLGLEDFEIAPELLATKVMQAFSDEYVSIREACQKVFSL